MNQSIFVLFFSKSRYETQVRPQQKTIETDHLMFWSLPLQHTFSLEVQETTIKIIATPIWDDFNSLLEKLFDLVKTYILLMAFPWTSRVSFGFLQNSFSN